MQHWVRSVFEDLIWHTDEVSEATWKAVSRIIMAIETQDIHLFRTSEMEKIADGLSECFDLEELTDLMWKATTTLHFQNFAIFLLKQSPGSVFKSRICTSFCEQWITRYVDQEYQFVDPVMIEASARDGWFCFADLENRSPATEAFWVDAENHRVGRNGVCCVISRSDGTRIGISFSSDGTEEKVADTVKRYGLDIQCIAQHAADAFCFAVAGPAIPDGTLTKAELRFLSVLSSSSNPEDALKIPSCFGSNDALQMSIRRKLGVTTIFQAVAIAASKGWFNQLPLDSSDIVRGFTKLQGLECGDAIQS